MNPRVAELVTKVVQHLYKTNLLPDKNRPEAFKSLCELLGPLLYPEKCDGCGEPLCPSCGAHCDAPVATPKNDVEGYPFCAQCGIYVLPDGSEQAISDPSIDSRFLDISDLLRGTEKDPDVVKPPKKEWTN